MYLRWNLLSQRHYVLTSDELELRPPVAGVYPVFGGLAGGVKLFEIISMPSNFPKQSQNNVAPQGASVVGTTTHDGCSYL